MIVKLIENGIGEIGVDNIIFNIPTVQEIGRPKEAPLMVGKLVPLEKRLKLNIAHL